MILPFYANPDRMTFSERTTRGIEVAADVLRMKPTTGIAGC
jgi:hypothetical protein